MSMRAQISLQFDDTELFENFVTPYKESRLLNGLIIKCLSSYYYNEEVRNLIEGTSLNDVTDGEEIQTTQSIVDNIRASLIMQDYLASELQITVDNGTEDINNILNKTNEVAKQTGVAKTTSTESGANVLKIETKNLQNGSSSQSSDKGLSDFDDKSALSLLLNCVMALAQDSGNTRVQSLINNSKVNGISIDSPVDTDTSRQNESNEGSLSSPSNNTVSQSFVVENDFIQEEVVENIKNDFDSSSDLSQNIEENKEVVEDTSNISEDASDAMAELLGSLM